LTDGIACENFAAVLSIVEKRWRERRSRPTFPPSFSTNNRLIAQFSQAVSSVKTTIFKFSVLLFPKILFSQQDFSANGYSSHWHAGSFKVPPLPVFFISDGSLMDEIEDIPNNLPFTTYNLHGLWAPVHPKCSVCSVVKKSPSPRTPIRQSTHP